MTYAWVILVRQKCVLAEYTKALPSWYTILRGKTYLFDLINNWRVSHLRQFLRHIGGLYEYIIIYYKNGDFMAKREYASNLLVSTCFRYCMTETPSVVSGRRRLPTRGLIVQACARWWDRLGAIALATVGRSGPRGVSGRPSPCVEARVETVKA